MSFVRVCCGATVEECIGAALALVGAVAVGSVGDIGFAAGSWGITGLVLVACAMASVLVMDGAEDGFCLDALRLDVGYFAVGHEGREGSAVSEGFGMFW